MAEGFTTAGGAGAPVHDNRDTEPAPDADAPRGWTWNRQARNWQPKVRGPLVWQPARPQQQQDQDQAPQDTGGFPASAPDPDPGWADQPAPEPLELTSSDRADIRALVALLYTVPAEVLPLADPYCFGPLAKKETATGVIDAVSDIVAGSPRVARWAVSTAGLMPWVKLAVSLKPVAVNFLHHHITHSVEVEIDRESRTMTVTESDWSQYTAA